MFYVSGIYKHSPLNNSSSNPQKYSARKDHGTELISLQPSGIEGGGRSGNYYCAEVLLFSCHRLFSQVTSYHRAPIEGFTWSLLRKWLSGNDIHEGQCATNYSSAAVWPLKSNNNAWVHSCLLLWGTGVDTAAAGDHTCSHTRALLKSHDMV